MRLAVLKKWCLGLIVIIWLLGGERVEAYSGAEIELRTAEEKIVTGNFFKLEVMVRADEVTLGTDVVFEYDPQILKIVEIVPGEVYPKFSEVEMDNFNEGKVSFSGVSEISAGVVPDGVLFEVEFEAIDVGETKLEVIYDMNDSTGTGIIPFEGDEDNILMEKPDPLLITVEKASFSQRLMQVFERIWKSLFKR